MQHDQIKNFVAGTVADSAPIIPISAVLRYNIDVVCEYIARHLPVPSRNFIGVPRLIVIRSFDVNKPGEDVESLKGGVAGGSILQGVLKVGDEIEVRPGIVSKDEAGNMKCTPIYSRIMSLYAGNAIAFQRYNLQLTHHTLDIDIFIEYLLISHNTYPFSLFTSLRTK